MPEFDPTQCVLHGAKLNELATDLKEVKDKLFGNGRPGLAYLAAENAIWLKICVGMCAVIFAALVPLFFKVMF